MALLTPDRSDEFLAYYNEYFPKIQNYVYYRTGQQRSLAEDLTQEIFMKALERYETYDPSRAFQAWLYTIARNHLTDFYRKRREQVSYETLENVLCTEDDPASDIDRRAVIARITEALPQLTNDERQLITLRYIQELSTDEIAATLGKKANAIYVGLHRAIKKLRGLLGEADQDAVLDLAILESPEVMDAQLAV